MFAVLQAANVDWNVVAGAVATFAVTAIATTLGFLKGKKRVRTQATEVAPIAGASIMDNMTMMMLTEALKENTAIHRDCHACLLQIITLAQIGLKRD